MQERRHAGDEGGGHHWETRIAAEADDGARLQVHQLRQRRDHAQADDAEGDDAAEGGTSGEGGGGNGGDFGAGEGVAVIVAPAVRHDDDAAAAAHQFARERLGGEEMSPGAAGGEDEGRVHRATSSARTGRWRVSPSAKPSVSATANRDEPP